MCGQRNQLKKLDSSVRNVYISAQIGKVLKEEYGIDGAVHPNKPSGFRGRKELLNHALALVTTCP